MKENLQKKKSGRAKTSEKYSLSVDPRSGDCSAKTFYIVYSRMYPHVRSWPTVFLFDSPSNTSCQFYQLVYAPHFGLQYGVWRPINVSLWLIVEYAMLIKNVWVNLGYNFEFDFEVNGLYAARERVREWKRVETKAKTKVNGGSGLTS